jgi:hypothetical protein
MAKPKVTRNISFDPDILKAAEAFTEDVTKEGMSVFIVLLIREALEKAGAWPPPQKGKRPKA